MNREQEYLIQLSAAYLNSDKIRLREDTDIGALMEEAAKHNLFSVAYCALMQSENSDEIKVSDISKRYKSLFTDSIYNSNLTMMVYGELKSALTGAGIRFVPFKGAVLRETYPVPETRTMGDVDVLIDADRRNDARTALEKAGFKCVNSNGPVWDYDKNGIRAEVHTSLVNGKTGNNCAIEYFSGAIDKANFNGLEGRFEDNYHFEYLIAHLAHHFFFYGAGIRMVLDLAVMLKFSDVDINAVLSGLKAAGLDKFAENILTVCRKWYGVGMDFKTDTSKTEEFLASHGAFGFSNRNISAVIERKDMEDGKKAGKFRSRLRLLFPPYEKLKEIPYIKFIENRPYLTPFAWVYRFFYNLKNKRKFMMSAVKGLSNESTTAEAQSELEFFEEIGLA